MSKTNRVGHCQEGTSDKVYIVSIMKTPSGQYSVIGKGSRIYASSMRVYPKGTYNSLSQAQAVADDLWRKKNGRASKRYLNIENSDYRGELTMTDSWLMKNLEDDLPELDPVPTVTTAPILRTMTDEELAEHIRPMIEEGKKIAAVKAVRKELGCGLREGKKFVNDVEQDVMKDKRKAEAKERKVKREAENGARDWEVICVNSTGMEDSFDEGTTYVAEKHADPDMLWVWDRNAKKRECFAERFEKVKELV
jgi:ribosomal protein L7/L12